MAFLFVWHYVTDCYDRRNQLSAERKYTSLKKKSREKSILYHLPTAAWQIGMQITESN